ncbi:MAG TPA: D-glycero-beta-D-manno-heptose-7-phosphate kinase [Deltaproteobacteria bacterium]|nr:D-glycero-beta-D-manno-heptose-7-phosphate kinase [Deltaproteobacteria bacterium]
MDINKFKRCRILVIGDLMVDEYLWGDVDRISPEAPVQVVAVKNKEFTLGGSGNVVHNLATLGAEVCVAGVIGPGSNGRMLMDKFHELGVNTDGVIEDPGRFTTHKTRIIAANQHVLRIDHETKKDISEKTLKALKECITNKIESVDVVLISDYAKGVITPALLSHVVKSAEKYSKMTIADPKGLEFNKYSGVTLLTPNKKETGAAAGMEINSESDLGLAVEKILKSSHIDSLLVTCGKDGMVLFEHDAEPFRIHAEARQVFDVSGAGDTVLAVLGLAVASGASLKDAATLANIAAGIVVGKVGTATVTPDELSAALEPFRDPAVLKQKFLHQLADLSQELEKKGKRIVMTNGCFDLLHAGHIRLFAASKQLGDVLVVAIDDDESVRKLKGPGRPVLNARERVRILSALDSVDYVVVFSSDDLNTIMEKLRPAILTKGSDYTSDQVYGHEFIEQSGGRVMLIPVTEDISSTRIIDNIRKGS